jgi:polysaccharide biosynthesis protein PslH
MNILLLCNKSPYPPKEGGPIAMNMIVEGLISAGHKVKVLAVNSDKYHITRNQIPPDYLSKTGIELVDVDLRIKASDALFNLVTNRSYHVERFKSKNLASRLTDILKNEHFDVVQFEMLYMSAYLEVVRHHSEARAVLRAHNIEHLIWERIAATASNPLKKLYLGHLARTLKEYELSIINQVDGLATISETDKDFFLHAGCRIPVAAITFGIDLKVFREISTEYEFPSLFSIGAMNWIPNQEGMRWFLENVWMDIHRQFPFLKYYIAGREMPSWLTTSHYPNVIVVGEVEDALEFMNSKAIMIVPLFSGSGIRIKIIEAMAAGKAIISTSIGAEGIQYHHGEDLMIADSPCEFFEMISACVENQDLIRKIGSNAKRLIRLSYNRDQIIAKLLAFYQLLGV